MTPVLTRHEAGRTRQRQTCLHNRQTDRQEPRSVYITDRQTGDQQCRNSSMEQRGWRYLSAIDTVPPSAARASGLGILPQGAPPHQTDIYLEKNNTSQNIYFTLSRNQQMVQ